MKTEQKVKTEGKEAEKKVEIPNTGRKTDENIKTKRKEKKTRNSQQRNETRKK